MKHKKVRLHLPDRVVELEGTPEELAGQIRDLCESPVTAQVIPFPARGIYAHPSNQKGRNQ